ncbi:hypothetical protein G6F32_015684 [Rhizopus arrhizus]|nr:hypothetical protein G6F32_015684 [Rhizopus arrhizus]
MHNAAATHSRSQSRPRPGARSGNITNRRCMAGLHGTCRGDSRAARHAPTPFGSPWPAPYLTECPPCVAAPSRSSTACQRCWRACCC